MIGAFVAISWLILDCCHLLSFQLDVPLGTGMEWPLKILRKQLREDQTYNRSIIRISRLGGNTANASDENSDVRCPSENTWRFHKLEVPQNGWFIREHPIKMDDLGVPPFMETTTLSYHPMIPMS